MPQRADERRRGRAQPSQVGVPAARRYLVRGHVDRLAAQRVCTQLRALRRHLPVLAHLPPQALTVLHQHACLRVQPRGSRHVGRAAQRDPSACQPQRRAHVQVPRLHRDLQLTHMGRRPRRRRATAARLRPVLPHAARAQLGGGVVRDAD
eukprot:365569-Chlamydomonas_euryale.AAC.32